MNSPHHSATPCRRLAAAALALGFVSSVRADLVAYWEFNGTTPYGLSVDTRAGLAPQLLGGAAHTADAGGRTAAAGDRAVAFGTAQQRLHLLDASYFNNVAAADVMSVSFWIKHTTIRNATPFSMQAPLVLGARGFQTHAPWSNSIVYFDTAGCCDGLLHRVNVNPGAVWTDWNHVALIKNGSTKEIWVNGVLALTGSNSGSIAQAYSDLVIGNSALGGTYGEAVNGLMDDVAIFDNALSPADIALLVSGGAAGSPPATAVAASVTDSDADTLPDLWEKRFAGNVLTVLTSATADNDSDGLDNATELARGTNPMLGDSDADGLLDGVETGTLVWTSAADRGTLPNTADTDSDGLLDGVENNNGTFSSASSTGTNPHFRDHDGDLVRDGLEVAYGSNPVVAASTPVTPGVPTLLTWWQFDDVANAPSPADTRAGIRGALQGASGYSADAEGQTGAPGDRALQITASGGKMFVNQAGDWANIGTRLDKLTVSYWIKVPAGPAVSSALWFVSPTAGGGRAYQAHCPYAGGTIYFDTSGCCLAGQRLTGTPAVDWTQWRHVVLMKDGASKKVYVDGVEVLGSGGAAVLPTDISVLHVGSDTGGGSIIGYMDDFAVFGAALNTQDITDLATRAKTPLQIGSSSDSDGDSLPDSWEYLYFPADLTKLGAAPADFDADGSTDTSELAKTTDPTNPDTDGDTLFDGVETKTGVWQSAADTGTDPLKVDTDGDTLPDGAENCSGNYVDQSNTGTNPNLPDTDGDTFGDAVEGPEGSNPNLPGSVPFAPGTTALLAWWKFDDSTDPAQSVDTVRNRVATMNTATFSGDTLGHTGQPGDQAACTSFGGVTASAAFVNLASPHDKVTISFWQKLNAVRSSSSFWITSPSSSGVSRGFQAHGPWGDGNIYYDTAGCCVDPAQRLAGPLPSMDVTQWHHWTFVKNGADKVVYIDGVQVLSGTGAAPLPTDFSQLIMGSSADNLPIDGCIDDFAVFGGVLTHEQICRLSAGETPASVLTPGAGGAFEITAVQLLPATNEIRVTWNSTPGCTYRIEMSTALAPGTWSDLAAGILSGGTTTTVTLPLPVGSTRLFLRVTEQ